MEKNMEVANPRLEGKKFFFKFRKYMVKEESWIFKTKIKKKKDNLFSLNQTSK